MARIRRHPGRYIALGILLCLAVCTGILLYRSKYCLTEAQYTIQSDKITSPVRVVQLTDLHNSTFGRDNEKLAELVAQAQPDLIFITGDLLNANVERTDIATGIITKLSAIAPVYVSLGNHETEYFERYGTDLIPLYQDAGATVLEQDYVDVTVNGQNLAHWRPVQLLPVVALSRQWGSGSGGVCVFVGVSGHRRLHHAPVPYARLLDSGQ